MVIFMSLNLWLREQDKNLLEELCKISLISYNDQILTGSLDNPGFLAKISKQFVLGRVSAWIPKDSDQKYPFVRIDNSSVYPNGIILTPYSDIDVDYHLKTRRIDRTTKFERVELRGMGSFVEQVFYTYYSSLVLKLNKKDHHFLLYFTRII